MRLFLEATLDTLTQSAISNFTKKHLNKRETEGESQIDLASATWHTRKDFLELVFYAKSSFGDTQYIAADNISNNTPNGYYTVVVRFYKVSLQSPDFQPSDFDTLTHSKLREIITNVVHNCDAKFYSDDMSFYWQGVWEDLYNNNMSIFKFTGKKGKGVWRDIHAASGGLANPQIRLTKHIAQVVRDIDTYITKIEQTLVITN